METREAKSELRRTPENQMREREFDAVFWIRAEIGLFFVLVAGLTLSLFFNSGLGALVTMLYLLPVAPALLANLMEYGSNED